MTPLERPALRRSLSPHAENCGRSFLTAQYEASRETPYIQPYGAGQAAEPGGHKRHVAVAVLVTEPAKLEVAVTFTVSLKDALPGLTRFSTLG